MSKYKVKNTNILHDGKIRKEGAVIELTDLQAKKLEGYVELVKDKAPAKQTTEKTTNVSDGNKYRFTCKNLSILQQGDSSERFEGKIYFVADATE